MVDSKKYPKAKYHATEPVACVSSAAEEAKLGPGWFDHPGDVNSKAYKEATAALEAMKSETADVQIDWPKTKRGPGRPPKPVNDSPRPDS